MADRVPRETGRKVEGASHKASRLGQQDSGLPRLGKRMRGGDEIAPSGFPLCFVTLIPDLTCALRFSGGRGLRKLTDRWGVAEKSCVAIVHSQDRGYFE